MDTSEPFLLSLRSCSDSLSPCMESVICTISTIMMNVENGRSREGTVKLMTMATAIHSLRSIRSFNASILMHRIAIFES